jgi:predicted ATPase/transcriptional regulator with XRE-family HTH domain/Tfp pilus assembly protein PilF
MLRVPPTWGWRGGAAVVSGTHGSRSFAEVLRRYRVAAGLSQEALAERAGLSVRGVSDLERGLSRAPRLYTLARLGQALGLTEPARQALARAAGYEVAEPVASPGPAPAPVTHLPGAADAMSTTSVAPARHNLPAPLTSFIGREREVETIKRSLMSTRLLTLTGPGGIGKSRLAAAVAGAVAPMYADGVWLVELASLADPALVPQAMAAALGVREQANRPVHETLGRSLGPKHLLLVLDNCEHVLGACAALAETLLRGCPEVRILTTSRQVLGVAGEAAWRVPSLAVPEATGREPLDRLVEYPAVRLFAERARAVRSGFTITPRNAPAVAEICRKLDGVPLAIELAAARVKMLSPEDIAARLHDRFRLLTGGSRTAPPRHQTLRAAMDWSYDLLTPAERVLLRRLSIFAGGLTLEAAEAVCAGNGIQAADVLDLLSELVDKSLVLAEPVTGEHVRYWLLETIRQYGAERLEEAGEAAMLRRRHVAWALALAERTPRWTAAQLARLAVEHDNLRAALRSSIADAARGDSGQASAGLRLGAAMWAFWYAHGYYAEGSGFLAELLRLPVAHVPGPARVGALVAAGHLAASQSRYQEAQAFLDESLTLAELLGDQQAVARAFHYQGMLAMARGDMARARALAQRSLELNRRLGKSRRELYNLLLLGRIDLSEEDTPAAARRAQESLALAKDLEDAYGVATSLEFLGRAAARRGELARARELLEQALAWARQLQHPHSMCGPLLALGQLGISRGETLDARRLLIEALTLANAAGEMYFVADALEGLAGTAEPERAAQLAGAAAGLRQRLGLPRMVLDRDPVGRWLSATRRALGEARYAEAWQAGVALPLDDAIQYALETPAASGVGGVGGPTR